MAQPQKAPPTTQEIARAYLNGYCGCMVAIFAIGIVLFLMFVWWASN